MKYYMLFFSVLLSFVTVLPICVSQIITVQASDGQEYQSSAVTVNVRHNGTVVTVELDDWVAKAVAYEAPDDAPDEFLKAMAVAMRTYAVYHIWQGDKIEQHPDCDLCSDPMHCKGMALDVTDAVAKAVSSTEGEIIYFDDCPINPIMHTASYALTASAQEIFGFDVEYLSPVPTPDANGGLSITGDYFFSTDELAEALNANGHAAVDCSDIMLNVQTSDSGRVKSVSVFGLTLSGARFALILGLPSEFFTAAEADEGITVSTRGIGSGLGMSKYGAYLLAQNGSDYRSILAHYYTKTYINNIYP